MIQQYTICLAGNPNSGKSSLFNALTGMNQKIANFPGVTVDKKSGKLFMPNGESQTIIDLPGTYSMHAITLDERIFTNIILDKDSDSHPDLICYVINPDQIDKQLLLASQLKDLGIPMIIALSMEDIHKVNPEKITLISNYFDCQVIQFSSRTGSGLTELKLALQSLLESNVSKSNLNNGSKIFKDELTSLGIPFDTNKTVNYSYFLEVLKNEKEHNSSAVLRAEVQDTMERYDNIAGLIHQLRDGSQQIPPIQNRIDKILIHPIYGMVIFSAIMFLIFQSIFSWAEVPMNLLERGFVFFGEVVGTYLPESWFRELLTNGILPGLSGIIVFVPQIFFLFLFISIMEESGYMSRVVYLFDFWMRKFGLNGRSTIALISGGACAIPAIMSTRTISNWKERLITILVTPMISCSARLPVYSLLIVFIIPANLYFGIVNARGLAFLGIYIFSTLAALFAAFVLSKIIKSKEKSQLMLELPNYRMPIAKNVAFNVWDKVKAFITEAGKVIFLISIALWFLTSYGPEKRREAALEAYKTEVKTNPTLVQHQSESSVLLENSFAGIAGQYIEPVIKPLGFDWKIGISLITSFAAREVFVGTLATIYSSQDDDEDTERLSVLLSKQVNPQTGQKIFNVATSASLIMFYMFALQCLSTVAVVKKETNGWKWPIIQLVGYTALAYIVSLITFQILS